MIARVTDYISIFNNNCVEPALELCKKHIVLISAIGITILLVKTCHKPVLYFDKVKKNIKFLTVVVPIAYTLAATVTVSWISISGGNERGTKKIFDLYLESIKKVWNAWFKFVEISV